MPDSSVCAKDKINVLLSDIEGPVNLGFICRSLANLGFSRLRFTGCLTGTEDEAKKFAVHASGILEDAEKFNSFDELVSGMDTLIGFSPRSPWDDGCDLLITNLQGLVKKETASGRKVGLLFGNEALGLSNYELAACNYRVALPTSKNYESMNLAQAVLVVIWELNNLEGEDFYENSTSAEKAKGDDLRLMLKKFEDLLGLCNFFYGHDKSVKIDEVRRVFMSKSWNTDEVSLLVTAFNSVYKDYLYHLNKK